MNEQDHLVESGSESGKKRVSIGRILCVVLVIGLCAVGIWVIVNFNNISSFQAMPSGAYAKFLCSSLFVVGMDEESAKRWASIPIPVHEVKIDYERKTVSARALLHTSVAQYENERFGCQLR